MSGMNIESALSFAASQSKPTWLQTWQAAGADKFQASSWPTRKTEAWKYTPLRTLQDREWSVAEPKSEHTGIEFSEWDVARVDIVNGVVKNSKNLPEGCTLIALADADETVGQAFLEQLNATKSEFHFDALNQALLSNGYWLKVDNGAVVSTPIHLNYVGAGKSQIATSQFLFELGENASATIVETFSAADSAELLVNANTQMVLQQNAVLTHYHLLLESGSVWHVGQVTADLNRSSRLTSFHMGVGGVVKRKDIVVRHKGEGAELSLNGVYLPTGDEVIDYHTCIEHEVPHCHSEEIFRGIIGDNAKAVFNGRIHIHKDAQKSIAEMNNRNLLLSDKAEIDTKPELEIYADDVRCAHGATIAQLDESLLFYFQARGISKQEAEVMLSFGFINELLDALNDEPVQQLLRPMLAELFSKNQQELTRHLV